MVKVCSIAKPGGPESLIFNDVEIGRPGAGQIRINHHAIGLNFIDIYHRSGLYPLPSYPSPIGLEAVGIVEEIGEGVTEFKPGDRVGYGVGPLGAYAKARLIPAEKVVKLPENIDFREAAAGLLKGLTAQYLLRRTYKVSAGDTILIHAAAGGVGLIACQWAKALGATVIGTVGSDEKAELAKAHGCDYPVVYTRDDFVGAVRDITDGEGVPVVYDSIGKATFEKSLDCLRPLGLMVSFGNATGAVPAVDPLTLTAKGSLFLTRPSLMNYMAKREDLVKGAAELFDLVGKGKIRININQEYALGDVARAQSDLEARKTTGSTILIP